MALLKTAFIFAVLVTSQVTALVTVKMKDQVEVLLGKQAHISCNSSFSELPSKVMIQWFVVENGNRERIHYSEGQENIADTGTDYTERISVSKDNILTIRNVQLKDNRDFICQVGGMSAGNGESKTELKVYNAPEPPEIEGTHSGISVTHDAPSQIATCKARNGFPKPNITWYQNLTPLQNGEDETKVSTKVTRESSGMFTVDSQLFYKVAKEDMNTTFYCEVSYFMPGTLNMFESNRINITVHYPTTEVEFRRESPHGLLKQGDTVKLRCLANGNPPPAYSFFKVQGEKEIEIKAEQDLLTLKDVKRQDSGLYRCKSLDLETFDEYTGDLDIFVNYLEEAVLTPAAIAFVEEGQDLSMSCNALSSQQTNIVWLKGDQKIGKGNTMTLTNASFDTAGQYTCKVSVPTLPDLKTSSTLEVRVQGAPRLSSPRLKIEHRVEAFVNLTCVAQGYPLPNITWDITSSKTWQVVMNRKVKQGVISVVTAEMTSDLTAACKATNDLGEMTQHFIISAIPLEPPTTAPTTTTTAQPHMKKNKKEGNGVIIVVIIVCILLLAILGSVLYFLYKKGKIPCGRSGKQDLTKEKASKDDIVVELKAEKSNEQAGLLQGVNGDKKPPNNQCEKYIDLRN
ncbi:cell surface glycoprotein MUC18 isoform X2 [Amia ocellicauda]|uniref:cell surface glycoprotein MUC18 isoform X2 n=1 Tax=Amia ocellicauda TaxID=2972642 RepID=UPI0034646E7A|nr:MUC18 protein [Amia calva]